MNTQQDNTPPLIAIVGLACKFPGAKNSEEYWSLLANGQEALTELSDEQLLDAGVPAADIASEHYVKKGMFLDDMELFDREFFGFSPREGAILDPQHRHFLELGWAALEHAGIIPEKTDDAIGVFAGSGHNTYYFSNLLSNPDLIEETGEFLLRHTGNDKDFLATRLSYLLDLKGPSINIATACSTSLVAVHVACQSLLAGECDVALAGGVTILNPHRMGYMHKEGEILSKDGHCRPFDQHASGTIFGNGGGMVVLRRLEDAVENNDNILAVVRGSAINNDGEGKVSYLAPSVEGQAACIAEALDIADLPADAISYVEAHGTGTAIGDPIEVAALTQAFFEHTDKTGYCGIGSVKSNIGHTDTAAGIASLIKVVLAMQHKQLPATLNFSEPNRSIDFPSTPFYVNSELTAWESEAPLRAGVSSLGVGGTNAHVILEEAPANHRQAADDNLGAKLFVLSAKSETALVDSADNLARHIEQDVDQYASNLSALEATLQLRRQAMPYRGYVVAADAQSLVDQLHKFGETTKASSVDSTATDLCFLFAGGGAQYPGMGLELYETYPVYRESIDHCLNLLSELLDYDLRSLLFPDEGMMEAAAIELRRPSRSIPSLFVTQYAQAQLWLSWGVKPSALLGHSMGEITAACIAGVFDLPGAIGLIALRGQLFEQTEKGGMLNVALPINELQSRLLPGLAVASVNAPDSCVASGNLENINSLEASLKQEGIQCARVFIDVAAHSPLLDPILPSFKTYLEGIELNHASIPFVSNITGDWVTAAQVTSPEYWVDHMRSTVQFAEGAMTLLRGNKRICLEVGPGRTLSGLTQANVPEARERIFESMPAADAADMPAAHYMLTAFGSLWQSNAQISWEERFRGDEVNLALPTYPFQGKWCWLEPGTGAASGQDTSQSYANPSSWFHQPVWRRSPMARRTSCQENLGASLVLTFPTQRALASELRDQLRQEQDASWLVELKDSTGLERETKTASCALDDSSQLQQILQAATSEMPLTNLYCLFAESGAPESQAQTVNDNLALLMQVAKLLMELPDQGTVRLTLITRQAYQIAAETIDAAQSIISGAGGVIPKELPNVLAMHIDIDEQADIQHQAVNIIAETAALNPTTTGISVSAWRNNLRFTHEYQRLEDSQLQELPAVGEGTYLITGGMGGLGLAAAESLAAPGVHLVLANRSEFIPKERWEESLSRYGREHPIGQKLEKLAAIEKLGATLETIALDVTDAHAIAQLVAAAQEQGRDLKGVVHTAGILDDNLIALKTPESVAAVLSAKVSGAVALQQALGQHDLDFMVLYSSISSVFGLPGQVDYAAANAFLNGFALQLSSAASYPVTSILWPAWQDVGMAAEREKGTLYRPPATGHLLEHPMIDAKKSSAPTDLRYLSTFSTKEDWVVDEHRLHDGSSLMPGSGYLELAFAAYRDMAKEDTAVFREVNFFAPCFVPEDTEVEIQIDFEPLASNGFRFTIKDADGSALEPAEYCTGQMESLPSSTPTPLDIDAIRQRCTGRVQSFDDPDHHPLLKFGDRWRALSRVNAGDDEALIDFRLPDHYSADMPGYSLHPAIVDMATAGAQIITQHKNTAETMLVPMAYQEIQVHRPVPLAGVSHVRLSATDSDEHASDIVIFNVDLCDTQGNLCVSYRDFLMRPIEPSALQTPDTQVQAEGEDKVISEVIALGISAEAGASALKIALGSAMPGQVMVLPRSPQQMQDELNSIGESNSNASVTSFNQDTPELDEVGATLNQSEWVEDSVVRQYGRGDKSHVVAHILLKPGENATVSELRRYLKERVRLDLVPGHYQFVDKFTYNSSGSVNRTLLMDPVVDDSYVAPRTATEKTVSAIWSDILGSSRIGVHDNFFDVGGHSLLSIRAIVTMEKKLGVRLNQKTMVLQSLEQVAAEIDGAMETDKPAPATEEKGFMKRLLGR